ncbi:hypothetical protein IIV31_070L [Armadillidium vulgare iridescent virus]|uniref:Uncharacterized protein n=1 Tax=Armadillidium vulgare iridescent virus TaxID=72201 RepID=A0A068QK91_9VIRU|nr:hypothetical protein IIV31_070L [Armadillidium vulgare iridescent virus]CCV02442.1 hypothetical protein IIV31_070L [Armadillidium vulgare iridescent virus]
MESRNKFMVFLALLLVAIVVVYTMTRKKKDLKGHMKARRQELTELVKKKIGVSLPNLIQQYCPIPDDCMYPGPVPLPDELVAMDAITFRSLDNCGALRSIMNSWAIAYWVENSTVATRENLVQSMTCASQLPLLPATFTNFGKLVEACFTPTRPPIAPIPVVPPVVPPVIPPQPVQPIVVPIDGDNDIGPPYDTNAVLRSGPAGWRPPNYYNKTSQLSINDMGDLRASYLNSYGLPRFRAGPYMSRGEIDAEELPRFEPSQWIVNNGPVRPWEPRYPVMTIPPVPIPLLGTSNM